MPRTTLQDTSQVGVVGQHLRGSREGKRLLVAVSYYAPESPRTDSETKSDAHRLCPFSAAAEGIFSCFGCDWLMVVFPSFSGLY